VLLCPCTALARHTLETEQDKKGEDGRCQWVLCTLASRRGTRPRWTRRSIGGGGTSRSLFERRSVLGYLGSFVFFHLSFVALGFVLLGLARSQAHGSSGEAVRANRPGFIIPYTIRGPHTALRGLCIYAPRLLYNNGKLSNSPSSPSCRTRLLDISASPLAHCQETTSRRTWPRILSTTPRAVAAAVGAGAGHSRRMDVHVRVPLPYKIEGGMGHFPRP
jgi:hypothetical protein